MAMTAGKDPYVYILVGVMGIIILGHWFPSLKSIGPEGNIRSTGCTSCANKLEQIQGLDLNALAICRQKGLL